MRRSGSMRSRLVPLVLAYAQRRGASADALGDAFQVPPALRESEAWSMQAPSLPIERVAALCDQIAKELDEPLLGLRVAQEISRGTYGVLEFAARNAPTIREAASRLVRYQRLINDAVEYSLVDRDGTTSLCHGMPGEAHGVGVHGNLFTLGVLHRYIGEAGVTTTPIRVEVAHGAPRQELSAEFGTAAVRFGAGHNALVYDAALFDRPVADADPTLLPLLDAYAAKLMPPEDPASGWRARVRDHLRRTLAGGAPSLEDTAAHFSTSARNVQRQLAAIETTYSAVVDELRQEEARRLVADPTLAVAEIAFLLGYSEARGFLRAFKRWTGEAPGKYRARA